MTGRKVWLFAIVLEDCAKQDPGRVQASPCCLSGAVVSELSTELLLGFDLKGAS